MARQKQSTPRSSKKHIARLEMERRQSRIIQYVTLVIVVFVVGILIFGFFDESGFPPRQKVASVNGEGILTSDFTTRVKLTRVDLINNYNSIYQYAQLLGIDPSSDPQILNQLQQIYARLNSPEILGQQVLDTMVDEVLIRQEAAKLNISISSEELDEYIHARFEYFPNGLPSPTATNTPAAFSTLSPTQLAIVTATPTPSPFPTPTSLSVNTQVPENTPTAEITPEPSPTPLTLEGFQANFDNFIDLYNRETGLTAATYRRLIETILLQDKIFDVITADVLPAAEQVWARHILVNSEDDAKKVLELIANGDDFADVAAALSIDNSNKNIGGDLGWFGRGRMVMEFEEAAFSLAIGEISSPVETQFGWHIIQVLGHENRPLGDSEFQQLRQSKFLEWLNQVRADAKIKTYEFWKSIVPNEPTIQ